MLSRHGRPARSPSREPDPTFDGSPGPKRKLRVALRHVLEELEEGARAGLELEPHQVFERGGPFWVGGLEPAGRVQIIEIRSGAGRFELRHEPDDAVYGLAANELMGAGPLAPTVPAYADEEQTEDLADEPAHVWARGFVDRSRDRVMNRLVAEQDPIFVGARDRQLLELEHGELDEVAVVIDDLHPVGGVSIAQSYRVGGRQPAQVIAQRFGRARMGHNP